MSTRARLARVLPAAEWLVAYRRDDLRGDLVAGVTTAVMLVPQGMAYAMLAGLPPIHGLYAASLPLVAYAMLGTSRQLAVGPVAMDSLLVLSGVGALAEPGSARFVALAIALAALVGALQLAMGLVRLGFLVNLLSRPVVSGFTSAAALIIGVSQLGALLGIPLGRAQPVHATVLEAAGRLGEARPATVALGLGAVALLLALERFAAWVPRALVVVALGTLAVSLAGLDAHGVATVGAVPSGLPPLGLPALDLATVSALGPTALAIALVAFMEAISSGTVFARRNGYDLDANRELVALGAANLTAGLFHGYPVAGGFSRTAVNAAAGARTQLASLVTAGTVLVTVLLLTPLFRDLPKAVLAAIVMTAVLQLVDVREAFRLWRVKRSDLAMLAVTFAATLLLGIQQGILVGVGASLALLVLRTTRPHVAVLGRRPSGVYRNVLRHPDAVAEPGVLAVRLDAQFYFGNVNFLRERLRELERASDVPLRAVVIDACGMNQIDSSATTALAEMVEDYARRDVLFHLANLKGPVLDVLRRDGFAERLGEARVFDRIEDAVDAAVARTRAPAPAARAAPASAGEGQPRERHHADQALLR